MAAALTITPPSGEITAKLDVVRVNVTGAEVNNADGTQHRYRIRFDAPTGFEYLADSGYSYVFNVSADGKHEFNGYVFPVAGDWTVRLHDEEADTDVADEDVEVA